jgi:hypothetical protein
MTDYIIETLAKQPGRDLFDCGEADLNEWLRYYASQSDARGDTLTRVALEPNDGRIIGYYAQKAYQLQGDELKEALGDRAKYPVPAVLLARLARCRTVAGARVGELLLTHALRATVRVSSEIGVQAVVVHAIGSKAAAFYENYGFTRFVDHPNHLLIPTKTLKKTFSD